MQQLHLVGPTTDHRQLILSARRGSKSGSYAIALDDELLHLIDEALRERRGEGDADHPEFRRLGRAISQLSPREIQSRLRAGRDITEVASDAGVEVEWIARFAAPVLAEQAQVIDRARLLSYATARKGASAQPLGTAVRWNVADRGVRLSDDEFDAGWSAHQLREGSWIVKFQFVSRRRPQVAAWEVDFGEGSVAGRDRLASALAFVPPRARPPAADMLAGSGGSLTATSAGEEAPADDAEESSASVPRRRGPAKRRAAKKGASKKRSGAKKAPAKRKSAANKAPAKRKSAANKAPAKKKSGANKAAAKKKSATKAPAKKKAAVKKAAAKTRAGKKKAAPVRKTAKKAVKKLAANKRAVRKKAAPTRKVAKKSPAKRKAAASKRAATTRPAKKAQKRRPATRAIAVPRPAAVAAGPGPRPGATVVAAPALTRPVEPRSLRRAREREAAPRPMPVPVTARALASRPAPRLAPRKPASEVPASPRVVTIRADRTTPPTESQLDIVPSSNSSPPRRVVPVRPRRQRQPSS